MLFLCTGLIFFSFHIGKKKNSFFYFTVKFRMLGVVLQSHRILDQGRDFGNPWVQPGLTDKT